MEELHLDIIIDRTSRKYNLILKSNKPQVAYKEIVIR